MLSGSRRAPAPDAQASARRDIAALLKADLFRDGIDGEALDWACERMLVRAEDRRLLRVISDGCPMDGATALATDAHYLDQHLREVVARRWTWAPIWAIRACSRSCNCWPIVRGAEAPTFRVCTDGVGLRRH